MASITKSQYNRARGKVGNVVDYTLNSMTIKVKITDVKIHGSLLLYRIVPISGDGANWVQKFTKVAK